MKRAIVILVAGWLLMSACNPLMTPELRKKNKCNDKYEKLVDKRKRQADKFAEKCPGNILIDTIRDTVTITVPEIRIDTSIQVNDDVSGVDSIIAGFQDDLDSATAVKIITQIKWYVKERPCLTDTLIFEQDGVTVKVYQEGDEIKVSFFKPEEEIEEVVEIEIERIVEQELTMYEKFVTMFGKFWRWILLVVVVGALAYIFRGTIKTYIPWLK